jgi:DNA-binding NarL/FixJ family response regulator
MKPNSAPKKIRVALVEDDRELRKLFGGWLKAVPNLELAGEYADAETAIQRLPQCGVDVVLVDINLPGLNGIECVRALKTQLQPVQFIMVTVYREAKLIFDALGAGATGYLLKRSTRDELLDAIVEVVNGGSPMSSSIARMIVQSFQRLPAVGGDVHSLAPREQQVLELLSRGFSHKEIAADLGISIPTVGTYVRRIYEKLHVHTRAQAIAKLKKP